MSTKKGKFLSAVVKHLKGDDADSVAAKIQKNAIAQIKAQIAIKEAKTLELESLVEIAEEELNLARFNQGQLVINGPNYIKGLFGATTALDNARIELDNHKESIDILKENLEIIQD